MVLVRRILLPQTIWKPHFREYNKDILWVLFAGSTLLYQLRLSNIVLVFHDWGAPFALQCAVRNPQNIAGLVILNTFLTTDFRLPPAVASKITPSIIKDSAILPEKISEQNLKAYWAPFPDDESKQAYQAFARMFPDSNYHPSFKPLKEVEQGLTHLKVPTTIIWGTGKSGTTYAERISKMIPESKLETVNAGHFVPEDSPQEVEKLVQDRKSTRLN